MSPDAQAAWDAAATATRHARDHYLTHPVHHPTPQQGPTTEQLARLGLWLLTMHHPRSLAPMTVQECSCGSALVLCSYHSAITRYLGPAPWQATPVGAS